MTTVYDFKAGDRVRYVGRHSRISTSEMIGKLGTVLARTGGTTRGSVPVQMDHLDRPSGFFPENIEIVSPEPTTPTMIPELAAGVKVRFKPNTWLSADHQRTDEGVITEPDDDGWRVEVPGKGSGYYSTYELEAIPVPVPPAAEPSLPELMREAAKSMRDQAADLTKGADAAEELAAVVERLTTINTNV